MTRLSPRSGAPGSLLWLVAFGLRVGWRNFWSSRSRRGAVVFLALALAALHAGAFFLLREARGLLAVSDSLSGPALWIAGAGTLFVLGLLIATGVRGALEALFERGDLDLLLSSPLPSRTVFAARALGLAVQAVLSVALLALPLLSVGLLLGLPRALGVVPWLAGLALLSTSAALLITLGLARLLGVRRARTVAAVVGAFLGAGFFLFSQARNILGQDVLARLAPRLENAAGLFSDGSLLGPGSLLWYPARAIWLEPLPTLLTLGLALALFWLTVRVLERTFRFGAQEARIVARRPARAGAQNVRFRAGWRAILVKEWRLIFRDPLLLSQTLLQLLYLLPMFALVARPGGALSPGTVIGSAGVLLGGQLAGALARITISGEDAPDLLRLAPSNLETLRRAKLLAALLPVWMLFAPLFALLAGRGDGWWPLRLGLFLLSTLGAGLIYLWRPLPQRRADLFRRGQRGDWLSGLGVLAQSAGLLAANAGLARGAWWGALGLGVGVAVPAAFGLFLQTREQDVDARAAS